MSRQTDKHERDQHGRFARGGGHAALAGGVGLAGYTTHHEMQTAGKVQRATRRVAQASQATPGQRAGAMAQIDDWAHARHKRAALMALGSAGLVSGAVGLYHASVKAKEPVRTRQVADRAAARDQRHEAAFLQEAHRRGLVAKSEPRHTWTDGQHHRDEKGRFASVLGGAAAGAGFTGVGAGGLAASLNHHEIRRWDRITAQEMTDFIAAARQGDKVGADEKVRHMAQWDKLRPYMVRDRNKYAALAAGGAAVGAAGLYAHSRANRRVGAVEKNLQHRVGQKLDGLHITGEQARNAGVFGQIGGGAGALGGAAVGAGIGAATRHVAQGAGIGAAVGGALGGTAGAGVGLYAGRPANAKRRKKQLAGTAPTTLAKSYEKTKGAAVGAGSGLLAGEVIRRGAQSAAQNQRGEARMADHLADYKMAGSRAKMLDRTADFHGGIRGRSAMVVGGALTGAALVRHHQRKIASQVDPIAKMDDETKTKLARGGLIGAQVADIAAIKSAWHETTTARKTGTGVGAALNYGAKRAALPVVAGGLVASVGAERVMHSQAKKLKAQQSLKKPTSAQVNRTTNP